MTRLLAKSPTDRPQQPNDVAQALASCAQRAHLDRLIGKSQPRFVNEGVSQTPIRSSTDHLIGRPSWSLDASSPLTPIEADNSGTNVGAKFIHWALTGLMGTAGLLFAVVTFMTDESTLPSKRRTI